MSNGANHMSRVDWEMETQARRAGARNLADLLARQVRERRTARLAYAFGEAPRAVES